MKVKTPNILTSKLKTAIISAESREIIEFLEKEKINNISQYYLSRIGSNQQENIFNSLSEGEKNFISFLYLLLYFKLDKINMAEALKSVE